MSSLSADGRLLLVGCSRGVVHVDGIVVER